MQGTELHLKISNILTNLLKICNAFQFKKLTFKSTFYFVETPMALYYTFGGGSSSWKTISIVLDILLDTECKCLSYLRDKDLFNFEKCHPLQFQKATACPSVLHNYSPLSLWKTSWKCKVFLMPTLTGFCMGERRRRMCLT